MISEKAKISKIPYRNLSKVIDLLVFDRTQLSLFKNDKEEYFLLYLFDSNKEYDEYLFWKVRLIDLYGFLYKRVSLRDLILNDSKEFVFIIYSDYETIEELHSQEYYLTVDQVTLHEIEPDWLPKKESFWAYEIPIQLIRILENFATENYLELLREKSVYFILEPRGDLNASTVSVADVVNFLDLFIKSYLSYVIFEYQTKFQRLISHDKNFQNSLSELKTRLLPRISDNKFGSFEVGLGVDDLNPIAKGDIEFFDWQKQVLESYKDEVFALSFDSMQETDGVLNKYPLDVRRKIFNPIYAISNNQRYTVKTTNRLKTYIDELSPITKEVKKIITSSDEDFPEQEPEQLEYITATVTVRTGENIADLDKKVLRKNLISVTRSDTTIVKRQESFTIKKRYFKSISELSLKFAISGLIHILFCDVFSIEVDSLDPNDVYNKLEQEIYNYYVANVMNNPSSPEARVFAVYFEVFDN